MANMFLPPNSLFHPAVSHEVLDNSAKLSATLYQDSLYSSSDNACVIGKPRFLLQLTRLFLAHMYGSSSLPLSPVPKVIPHFQVFVTAGAPLIKTRSFLVCSLLL